MREEEEPDDERNDGDDYDERRDRLDGADERAPVALCRVHRVSLRLARSVVPAASLGAASVLGDRAYEHDHDDDREDYGEHVEQQPERLTLAAQLVQHE